MSHHKPSSKPSRKVTLVISSIQVNAGTQSRADVNEATVAEYAEAMIRGDRFPPVIVSRLKRDSSWQTGSTVSGQRSKQGLKPSTLKSEKETAWTPCGVP